MKILKAKTKLKLDLGCGKAKVKDAIGVDKFLLPGVDIVTKLDKYPYPFSDNTFDEIYLNDVIEHLPDTIQAMEEIYRISKPNAKVYIRTINWNSHYNAMDPTHIKTFNEHTFDFFGMYPGREYYSTARFDVLKVKLGYNAQARKLFKSEKVMKFLSHYLNNVLEDLNFELKALKPGKIALKNNSKDLIDIVKCPKCIAHKHKADLKLVKNQLVCQKNHKYKMEGQVPII
jgi:SAM-dependent methyltransferase